MMALSSVSNATAAPIVAPKTTAQQASLDYNSFLKLLLQQMKSQDPTHPMDQTQMLAQLAQFSNVGQTIQINDKLSSLINATNTQGAASLIGKSITSLTDGTSGIVKSIQITSSGSSAILTSGAKIDLATGIQVDS
jgi:flagellar basal-body rod modification protein FlgD